MKSQRSMEETIISQAQPLQIKEHEKQSRRKSLKGKPGRPKTMSHA